MTKTRKPTEAMQVDTVVPPPITAPLTERMLTGKVASGRCVETPTGEKTFRCFNALGEAVYAPVMKRRLAPDVVTLPESEFLRLQAAGFIEDPDKIVWTEAEAVQLMGALIVDLKKDAADGEHARADDRGASARIR